MRRLILIIGIMLAAVDAATLSAQQLFSTQHTTIRDAEVCGLSVSDISMKRNAGLMTVGMNIHLSDLDLTGDRAVVFAPVLINGADSLALAPIGLYSRMRYIQYVRYGRNGLGGINETSYRYPDRPETEAYLQAVPYEEWMNGATLYMRRCDYGCCNTLMTECSGALAGWYETGYSPAYRYVTPVAENVKMRELSGRAYIDFPVNRTELYPDYRNNPSELARIIATIDSVRNDKDVTVKRITIKGWASPESSWENNTRLAKGRTATLKQYVQHLYHFPEGFIETDYEPEDWAGLRAFVESSNMARRDEILAIIDDTTLAPDPKEEKLKKRFPEEYKFLLSTVYPGLRHSDYTIEYSIRRFSDIDEIRKTMATAPQKLSLNEMFLLAKSLEPGSEEYNEVFETAVRMYPDDETANLNAASSAMQRGDMTKAGKYLTKAGDSDEAVYARGVYAAKTGDYAQAAELFGSIGERIPEADEAFRTIQALINNR